MAKPFNSRITKLNQLKKKLRLDNQKLMTYIESDITLHELELILGSNDTIYLNEENVKAIEQGIAKALEENKLKLNNQIENDQTHSNEYDSPDAHP